MAYPLKIRCMRNLASAKEAAGRRDSSSS